MYTASFLKPVSYVNLYCHKNCHIFTQFTIKYNCIMHLCWHRVLYSTIHTLLLPTPLPQISHGFSLCCFLQEESWICSAIQIAWTWEWLFWGKTQVCLDRIMSQSSQKQWFREEPHIRTTLKYQRNSLKADSGSQQSVAQRLKYDKRQRAGWYMMNWEEELEMEHFRRRKYVPSSHYCISPNSVSCYWYCLLPSKRVVFHMDEVAKMKLFPFLPHKTSFWLELASCSYSTWRNQSFSPPTLAPSAARLSSRARCQQSRLLWEEKVLLLEFLPYTLQGASLWSLESLQRATSSLPCCFPMLIHKEGSWGQEQKEKTLTCTMKLLTSIFT